MALPRGLVCHKAEVEVAIFAPSMDTAHGLSLLTQLFRTPDTIPPLQESLSSLALSLAQDLHSRPPSTSWIPLLIWGGFLLHQSCPQHRAIFSLSWRSPCM